MVTFLFCPFSGFSYGLVYLINTFFFVVLFKFYNIL